MKAAPQIAFEGFEPSDAVRGRIDREVEKLERFFGRITSCRVVVARAQHRRRKGDLYTTSVHLALPDGRDVAANRNPPANHAHEDVLVAIRDSFAAARRQLQDQARKLRGEVKAHEAPPEAVVRTLIAEGGYGFLQTAGGREVYFHRNSVADNGYERLRVGDRVTFTESEGDDGPQARFVKPA